MDNLKLYPKNERVLDSTIQVVRILTEEIEVQFGMDKSTMLVMKKAEIR